MKITEHDGVHFLHFTYEEETRFAEWLLNLMSKKWFSRENCGLLMYQLVNRLYWRKCDQGKDITLDDYADLGGEVAFWNDRHPPYETEDGTVIGADWQLPMDVFEFEDDGKERVPPTMTDAGKKLSLNEQVAWIRQDTRRAWRQVWKDHPIRRKGADDEFLVFPGDDPDETHAEVQVERERRFWSEVDRICAETEEPRREVIKYVSDYMPRGVTRMSDPNKGSHESLMDRMEVEYPDPD